MHSGFRLVAASVMVAAATFIAKADVQNPTQSTEIQLQLGDLLFSEGRFLDSLDAYKNALKTASPDAERRPRIGVIASALRVAEFDLARSEAEKLYRAEPTNPDAMSLYGDALWSAGLFQEAETKFHDALAKQPDLARGHHGMAKSLAASGGRVFQLRQPAAEQGSQREGRLVARGDSVPAVVRPACAVRSRSRQ